MYAIFLNTILVTGVIKLTMHCDVVERHGIA